MKKGLFALMCIVTVVLGAAIWIGYSSVHKNPVLINEVCSSNFAVCQNDAGEYCDYIELFNSGDTDLSLEGYCLSDDSRQLDKFPLGAITIPAGGYYLFFLDGSADESLAQTAFQVSKAGERLFLSNQEDGRILDSVVVPQLKYNTVYGRIKDGKGTFSPMSATPGATNTGAELLPLLDLTEPVLSVQSGFYDKAFSLSLETSLGNEIHYTLDGSEPTKDSPVYREPLYIEDASTKDNLYANRTDLSPTRDYTPDFKVDKATVLRAISYNPDYGTISPTVTAVYFVGFAQKQEYSDFPVISLVTDPENLFSPATGIYGNGDAMARYLENGGQADGEILEGYTDDEGNEQYLYMASNAFEDGREWEREAVFDYFDATHSHCFMQPVGIQIAGQSTRATPQKSFSIYGRKTYLNSKENKKNTTAFPYAFFENTAYSSIKLRNGGNENAGIKFMDAFLESLVEDRDIAIQRSTPCILFLNGEYWGIYNIRERYKEEYLTNHYQVSDNNIWIMDAGTARVGDGEAQEAYEQMLTTLSECDLSYDDVYEMATADMDVQSFLDYLCINLYYGNADIDFGQNTALWRTIVPEASDYGDCKWRWMLFDLDDSLHAYEDVDSKTYVADYVLMQEKVVQSLMRNAGFRAQFLQTLQELSDQNFVYEEVHEELHSWQERYEEQMVKNHQRFFDAAYQVRDYEEAVQAMDAFFQNRNAFIMQGAKAYCSEFEDDGYETE